MVPLSDLSELVERLGEADVACVGDLMLDRFIYGEVERVSPEAPVPVLRVASETEMLGGAGNVVRNLAALRASSALAAVVGDDVAGQRTELLLRELPQCRPCLVVEHGRGTTIKTRCIGANQQILRVDREQCDAITGETAEVLLAHLKEALKRARACILSDYGKGVLTAELTGSVIALAKRNGVRVVIDPKGSDYERYRGADVITPNRDELTRATGMPARREADLVNAARQLRERYDIGIVVVTRSEEGLSVVEAETVHHLPAESQEVYDVSGAGDTVVATLAAALAVGAPIVAAAQLANVAAGIAVRKLGTAATEARELQAELRQQQVLGIEGKVVDWEQACRLTQAWQAEGLAVGFTNGCFDLVHPGHVGLLENARKRCDRLVVGLNGDASVKRLKGPQRPLQNEAARATVLASMSSVDLVVTFDEDTPLALLELLRPDALFKGADYALDEVVGAELVHGYGGRVELIEIVPEQSTTRIVDRMSSV